MHAQEKPIANPKKSPHSIRIDLKNCKSYKDVIPKTHRIGTLSINFKSNSFKPTQFNLSNNFRENYYTTNNHVRKNSLGIPENFLIKKEFDEMDMITSDTESKNRENEKHVHNILNKYENLKSLDNNNKPAYGIKNFSPNKENKYKIDEITEEPYSRKRNNENVQKIELIQNYKNELDENITFNESNLTNKVNLNVVENHSTFIFDNQNNSNNLNLSNLGKEGDSGYTDRQLIKNKDTKKFEIKGIQDRKESINAVSKKMNNYIKKALFFVAIGIIIFIVFVVVVSVLK